MKSYSLTAFPQNDSNNQELVNLGFHIEMPRARTDKTPTYIFAVNSYASEEELRIAENLLKTKSIPFVSNDVETSPATTMTEKIAAIINAKYTPKNFHLITPEQYKQVSRY